MDIVARNREFLRRLYAGDENRPAWTFLASWPAVSNGLEYTLTARSPAEVAG